MFSSKSHEKTESLYRNSCTTTSTPSTNNRSSSRCSHPCAKSMNFCMSPFIPFCNHKCFKKCQRILSNFSSGVNFFSIVQLLKYLQPDRSKKSLIVSIFIRHELTTLAKASETIKNSNKIYNRVGNRSKY
jgi:hypothetical protein